MFKRLLITAAVSAALGTTLTTPAFAQQSQQGQGQNGGQVQTTNQQRSQEQTQGQGAQVYVSPAGIRRVQQALNQKGFDVGKLDGQWSKKTTEAAGNYQKSQGLEPTGTLTVPLLNSLGMSQLLTGNGQGAGGNGSGNGQNQNGNQGQNGGQNQNGQGGNKTWSQELAQGPGTPIYVSPAGVRQVQQALNQKGYDVGSVDGKWKTDTSKAAKHFQQAQGIEPNGQLDANLIAALGLSQQVLPNGQGGQNGQGNQNGQSTMQWTQEEADKGTPLWVGPATLRQVEQALNQKGYDVGTLDGKWDDDAANGVKKFQKSQGLEPTGTLTTELLANLGQSNWLSGQGGGAGGQNGQSLGNNQGNGGNQGNSQQNGDNEDDDDGIF